MFHTPKLAQLGLRANPPTHFSHTPKCRTNTAWVPDPESMRTHDSISSSSGAQTFVENDDGRSALKPCPHAQCVSSPKAAPHDASRAPPHARGSR